ncbi:MAG: family metallo-hydrolase, partial [Sphingomonas bacterium]|nr:family metallo-hydrolase [Sphingomonas bacterium]
MKRAAIAILAAVTLAASAPAAPPTGHPQAEAQALELAKQAIALRSVRGPGNQTPQVAAL